MVLVKLLSFALIHFHSHYEKEDSAASCAIILPETSRSRGRIQRHIILCELCHCFSKTPQHYCTKRDDCSRIFMDYYSESDGSGDHKVKASIHSTRLGLTMRRCDYRGETVYFCLITAPDMTTCVFHNNLIL